MLAAIVNVGLIELLGARHHGMSARCACVSAIARWWPLRRPRLPIVTARTRALGFTFEKDLRRLSRSSCWQATVGVDSTWLTFDDELTGALEHGSWSDVFALAGREDSAEERALFSRPITILWALAILLPRKPLVLRSPEVCRVLVGGAALREESLVASGAFDLLAELLPQVRWELVMVGPGLSEEDAVVQGAGVNIRLLRGCVHECHVQDALDEAPVDFTVLFNSGLGCVLEAVSSPWRPSVPLLAQRHAPVLLTSFGEDEARVEQGALGVFDDDAVGNVLPNVFVDKRDCEASQPGRDQNRVVWWFRPN